jgi:hypothetical protein
MLPQGARHCMLRPGAEREWPRRTGPSGWRRRTQCAATAPSFSSDLRACIKVAVWSTSGTLYASSKYSEFAEKIACEIPNASALCECGREEKTIGERGANPLSESGVERPSQGAALTATRRHLLRRGGACCDAAALAATRRCGRTPGRSATPAAASSSRRADAL